MQTVKLLERLEQLCRARDRRVIQVMANLGAEYEVVLVARSDGVQAADVRPLVRLSVQVIVAQNGRRDQGTAGGGGCLGRWSSSKMAGASGARPAAAGAATTATSPRSGCRSTRNTQSTRR